MPSIRRRPDRWVAHRARIDPMATSGSRLPQPKNPASAFPMTACSKTVF
jgi:hypothetical protein